MSEETQMQEIPFEDRLLAAENQGYITYLMVNSMVKILTEKGILDKDQLAKEMDELNERLFELTEQLMQDEQQQQIGADVAQLPETTEVN